MAGMHDMFSLSQKDCILPNYNPGIFDGKQTEGFDLQKLTSG